MKVFVDIDGVLANFNRTALRLHGINNYLYPVRVGWDIIKACNILAPESNMTPEKFWAPFDQKFWATLPKTVGCDTLLKTVEGYVGQENVCLLTSGQWPAAAAGKTEWVMNHFPRYRCRLLIGTAKEFVAGTNRLLIDDRDKNVDDFRDAGGTAILVPRPWNTKWHVRLGDSHVLEQLANMFGRGNETSDSPG
jgi:5'(3')-deoxyribonucleotidase